MKKRLCLIFVFALAVNLIVSAQIDFSRELFEKLSGGINEAPEIQIPEYQRLELDNGMIFYLATDDQFPIIEITGFIRGGRSQESRELAGITSFMLSMMTTGTANYDEEKYSLFKGLHGLSFNMETRRDIINLSGNSLSEDKEHLIELIHETLRNPQFDTPYYDRIMQSYRSGIMQAKTQDQSLLDSYFYSLVYHEHPYSYEHDLFILMEALDNIDTDSLYKYYERTILPNRTAFAISGDFQYHEMEELLKEYFNDWKAKDIELEEPSLISPNPNHGRTVLVNKADATGARLMMGYDFFDIDFEYRTEFNFANRVFGGGGFSSRLTDHLRTRKGYVYGVWSRANYNNLGGEYFINTQIDLERVADTIEIIKKEMQEIRDGNNPIKQRELFEEINRTNGLLPKYYVEVNDLLDYMLFNTEYAGRDPNYLNEYIAQYNALDADTAQEAFTEYTFPERFITVIIGRKDIIQPQLEEAGMEFEVFELN